MRGRILILVGLVVLLGAVAVGFFLLRGKPESTLLPEGTPGEGTSVPYVPPKGLKEIVVAAQDLIPRGTLIITGSGAVQTATWPEDAVPEGALTDVQDAYGRITRVDIVRDMPLTEGMLTGEPGDLVAIGSDVALQIPAGKVAYALPVARYSAVAWALQPGDHVDVLISLLVVDLDEEFQTILPNQAHCISPSEAEACAAMSGPMGRLDVLLNNWVVYLTPGEARRPRLVTQLTVQDAEVLYVGDWPLEGEAPPAEPDGAEQAAEVEGEQPAPPSRAEVEPLTLIVTPQEAMVLKYAEEIGASIDLVLRSAKDAEKEFTTDAVTLQYLLEQFDIELPPKLPYGVTPPLQSLKSGATGGVGGGGGGE